MIPDGATESPESAPPARGEYAILGWALLIALGVRIYIAATTCVVSVDGVEYLHAADMIRENGIASAAEHFYPPGYPVAIIFARLFTENAEHAGQLASLFFGLLLVIVVYFFVREIFGAKAAAVAVLIAAFQHQLAKYSVQVRSESMFLAMQMATLFFAFRAGRGGSWLFSVLCGICGTIAFYARPEEGVALVAFCIALIIFEMIRRKRFTAARIVAPLICAVLFAAGILPFVIAVKERRAVGRETKPVGLHFSRKRDIGADAIRENLARSQKKHERPDEKSGAKNAAKRTAEAAASDTPEGKALVWIYLGNMWDTVRKFGVAMHLFCGLFMLIGIFYRRHSIRDKPAETAILIFSIGMILVLSLVIPKHRRSVQLVAPLLGFAAIGIIEISALAARALSGAASRKRMAVVTGIAVTMLSCFYMFENVKPRRIEKLALRRAGEYLASQKNDARVLTPEAPIVYYARGYWILDPARDEHENRGVFTRFPERLERAIKLGAEYLVLEMNVLLDDDAGEDSTPPPEVRRRVRTRLAGDGRLILEKEFPPHPWFPDGDRAAVYKITNAENAGGRDLKEK
ncbi:MAG: ArnT family glycosyltransferase [Planctomycetota bacterium]